MSIFVLIPLLMLAGLWAVREIKAIQGIMVTSASALLIASAVFTFMCLGGRSAGNTAGMLPRMGTLWHAPLHISCSVGVDGTSVVMLLLPVIIVFTGTFASWRLQPLTKGYFLWFTLLSIEVFGFFISADLFTMFMFYEIALAPMYLLIDVWGLGCKKYVAVKLTLMLMGDFTFLLIGILGVYPGSGATAMNLLEVAQLHNIPFAQQCIWLLPTFLRFGILGTPFPLHTWNPDGYASTPIAVSMLHTGVLTKLGDYRYFHIAMYLMSEAAGELSRIFLIPTDIPVVCRAFPACVRTDLKYVSVCSSASHCGLVLFVILMPDRITTAGATFRILSHGSMTALFFALIGTIYGRTHTHDIRELTGLMRVMPSLSVCYIIAGFTNLDLPGLSGFIAEMTIFVGSFQNNDVSHRVLTIIVCSSIVITAVCTLCLVGRILYSTRADRHHPVLTDVTQDERVAVTYFIICVTGPDMAPFWVGHMISESVFPAVSQPIP